MTPQYPLTFQDFMAMQQEEDVKRRLRELLPPIPVELEPGFTEFVRTTPGLLAVPTGTTKPLPKAGPLEPSVFLPAKPGETQGTQHYQQRQAVQPNI